MTDRHSRRFSRTTLDDLGVLRAAVETGSFVRAGGASATPPAAHADRHVRIAR